MEDHPASKTEQTMHTPSSLSGACCFAHSHYVTQSEMRLLRPILFDALHSSHRSSVFGSYGGCSAAKQG